MPLYTFTCEQCGETKEKYRSPAKGPPRFCCVRCTCLWMGPHSPRPGRWWKYQWTEEQDETIRRAYGEMGGRRAVPFLVRHPLFADLPRPQIRFRARDLGVVRRALIKPWMAEEEEIIKAYAGSLRPSAISKKLYAKGYVRSVAAVANRILELGRSTRGDFYTMADVAAGFGCPRRKVERWIKEGKLKLHEKNGYRGRSFIRPSAVAAFIRRHPYEAVGYCVDLPWVVALLDEFRPQRGRLAGKVA